MQAYIRPLGEGIVNLRALMKSALPLLNNAVASQAGSSFRVWGKLVCPIVSSTRLPCASCGRIPLLLSVHFFSVSVKPFTR